MKRVKNMGYKNLTELLSDCKDSRRYFMNLPVEMQLELHKYNDSVRTSGELRDKVEAINREKHYDAFGVYPHEYSLY